MPAAPAPAQLLRGAQGQPLLSPPHLLMPHTPHRAPPLRVGTPAGFRVWEHPGPEFLLAGLSFPSQAGPPLRRMPRPTRRPSPKMSSLGPPGAGAATVSLEEVSEAPPQPPRPQLRPGRLQQLQASLSLRLGSLDPDWLQRCHSGTPDSLGTPEACQPVLGTKEPQSLTSGVPSALGLSTGPEAPLQGSEAPESVQKAGHRAGTFLPGRSQGKKRRWNGDPEGSPAQAQQDSGQVGPLPEGAGAAVLAEDCPEEPVQAQPPSGPPAPRYHSVSPPARRTSAGPRWGELWARPTCVSLLGPLPGTGVITCDST